MFLPSWYTFLQTFGNFTELTATRLLALLSGSGRKSDEDVEEVENSPQMAALANALHAWSIFGKYAVYRTGTDTVQVKFERLSLLNVLISFFADSGRTIPMWRVRRWRR